MVALPPGFPPIRRTYSCSGERAVHDIKTGPSGLKNFVGSVGTLSDPFAVYHGLSFQTVKVGQLQTSYDAYGP